MLHLFLTGRRAAYMNDIFTVLHMPENTVYDLKYRIYESGDKIIHSSAEKENCKIEDEVLVLYSDMKGRYIPLRFGRLEKVESEEGQLYYGVRLKEYCHWKCNESGEFLDKLAPEIYIRKESENGKVGVGVFDKRDLMEKAHALMEKDPAFTSADMLAGLIGLSARSLWLDGKVYLINAIQKEMEKKQKYCAFMYYALGHFYEWQEEDLKKAWGEYEKIQEIDTGNYRALYKIAYRKFKKNDRVEAIKQFNEIYEMMKGREKKDWITPIETEYYYKCARFLEYLNADEKPTKVELRRIRERVFENSKCVQNFFEAEDIESCKPMLLENMENRGKYCR